MSSRFLRRAVLIAGAALGLTAAAGGLALADPTAAAKAATSHTTASAASTASTGTPFWVGNPALGQSVFYLNNCSAPGTLTVVKDSTMGQVWAYDKPAGDDRCETHGIRVNGNKYNFQAGKTYYIGWWSKVTNTVNNNADFQWKSYGVGMTQDYPFVISAFNGHASIWQRQPNNNGQTVWNSPTPLAANKWNHYVVGIYTSSAMTGGWIEIWYNGQLQKFLNGQTKYACRTWDTGNDNEPKWGEYGATSTAITNYVSEQKIGFTYASVAG